MSLELSGEGKRLEINGQPNRNRDSNETPRRKLTKKLAHFDENNILETFHPKTKNYGWMAIQEAATPYPRAANAVDALDLKNRLQAALYQANMQYDLASDDSLSSDSLTNEDLHKAFALKRKKFEMAEFLIAKQRSLSAQLHKPLESFHGRMKREVNKKLSSDVSSWETIFVDPEE